MATTRTLSFMSDVSISSSLSLANPIKMLRKKILMLLVGLLYSLLHKKAKKSNRNPTVEKAQCELEIGTG